MINSANKHKENLMITPEEMDNYREEVAYERRREVELKKHPDCRDPEHIGCEFCEDRQEETK